MGFGCLGVSGLQSGEPLRSLHAKQELPDLVGKTKITLESQGLRQGRRRGEWAERWIAGREQLDEVT
jgi:hypothetical protein